MCWAGLLLFKCYRRWIGGHPQQMNEGRYPHRGKPQTIMIHCGAPHIDTVPSRNRIGCQRVGGYVAIPQLCETRCVAYLFAPSPTHCLAANRKHAFGALVIYIFATKRTIFGTALAHHQSATEHAGILDIAAAQEFRVEQQKLETYSSKLTDILNCK